MNITSTQIEVFFKGKYLSSDVKDAVGVALINIQKHMDWLKGNFNSTYNWLQNKDINSTHTYK